MSIDRVSVVVACDECETTIEIEGVDSTTRGALSLSHLASLLAEENWSVDRGSHYCEWCGPDGGGADGDGGREEDSDDDE